MTQTHWHASHEALARYHANPDAIDEMTASSIESHLVMCGECRQQLTALARPEWTTNSWSAIADRIDRPRTTPLERLLGRFGMHGGIARLVAATPALQFAGIASIVAVAAAAVLLSLSRGTDAPFLVLAPLAPLAAVCTSFAGTSDPAGETGIATPLHGAGLVVRRAAVLLAVTLGVLALAALALPGFGIGASAWILPALALSLGALALGTWMPIEAAVAVLAMGWLTLLSWVAWAGPRAMPVVDSAAFSATGQLTALVVVVISIIVVVVRRDTFATLEARS
jgi:hypothetical protein